MPKHYKTPNIEAIDLFCGVGGLTYGLRKAKIKVLAGLDNDRSCKYAYEKNNNCPFIPEDIAEYDFKKMRDMYSDNSIKVLVGCAPCQPFSAHNYKNQKEETTDTRWNLINHFTNAVEIINPDIISMENVRGIRTTDVFKQFVKDLECLGYHISSEVLYCPDYGIAQNRSRLVLLGSKKGKIELPPKTHRKEKHPTVRDIIGDLPELKSGQTDSKDPLHKARNLSPLNIERIKQSKPKGTWKDWDPDLLPECYKRESGQSFKSVYGRMSWDSVSPTITTQFYHYGTGRFGHPDQDRGLSYREGALLQTFPKRYDFGKKIIQETIGRHIGNAVPPRLGRVIGKAIIEHTRRTK